MCTQPLIIPCLMSVGLGRIRANPVGTNWLDESEPGHSVTARVVDELSSILAGGGGRRQCGAVPSGRWCVTWRTKNWKTGESNPSTSLHRSRDQRRPVGLRWARSRKGSLHRSRNQRQPVGLWWAGGWQKNRAPREAQGRQVKNCRSHGDRQRRQRLEVRKLTSNARPASVCALCRRRRRARRPWIQTSPRHEYFI